MSDFVNISRLQNESGSDNVCSSKLTTERLQGAKTRFSAPEIDRFWAKVAKTGPDECWLWTALTTGTGLKYGQFRIRRDGQQLLCYAHRTAWELTNGPIAGNQYVCHHCDVPICVNPSHLFLGTQKDNLQDAKRKGRLPKMRRGRKLSEQDVLDIRVLRKRGWLIISIANHFNVTKAAISQIVNGHRRALVRGGATHGSRTPRLVGVASGSQAA